MARLSDPVRVMERGSYRIAVVPTLGAPFALWHGPRLLVLVDHGSPRANRAAEALALLIRPGIT